MLSQHQEKKYKRKKEANNFYHNKRSNPLNLISDEPKSVINGGCCSILTAIVKLLALTEGIVTLLR